MSRKKELIHTVSDLTTSGIVSNILTYIASLPPGVTNVMNMALPALACSSNIMLRLGNEKIIEKDRLKIIEFNKELQLSMNQSKVDDLQYFTALNFPIEIYSVVEEIIKEAINAKGKWLRKFAANIISTIGSKDTPNLMQGKRLCLNLLKELDETDIRILFLYEARRKMEFEKGYNPEKVMEVFQTVKSELLSDTSVYAQTISSSSVKLLNLGLISNSCSLNPYDEVSSNKQEMLENLLSQNRNNATAHYRELQKYLYTFV